MGIMWDLIEHVQLPKVVKVRQNFDETRLENVELAVREQQILQRQLLRKLESWGQNHLLCQLWEVMEEQRQRDRKKF